LYEYKVQKTVVILVPTQLLQAANITLILCESSLSITP
jgi:hypothetical protein